MSVEEVNKSNVRRGLKEKAEKDQGKDQEDKRRTIMKIDLDGKPCAAAVEMTYQYMAGTTRPGEFGLRFGITELRLGDISTIGALMQRMEKALLQPKNPEKARDYKSRGKWSYPGAESYLIHEYGLERDLAREVADHLFLKWHSEGRKITLPPRLEKVLQQKEEVQENEHPAH